MHMIKFSVFFNRESFTKMNKKVIYWLPSLSDCWYWYFWSLWEWCSRLDNEETGIKYLSIFLLIPHIHYIQQLIIVAKITTPLISMEMLTSVGCIYCWTIDSWIPVHPNFWIYFWVVPIKVKIFPLQQYNFLIELTIQVWARPQIYNIYKWCGIVPYTSFIYNFPFSNETLVQHIIGCFL